MYLLGFLLYATYGKTLLGYIHGEAFVDSAKQLFEQNAFTAQFVAALTPLPDRVFSFLAGAFVVSPILIFIATFLGRLVRIAIVAYIAHRYGDEGRGYIKKHTQRVFVIVALLLIAYIAYIFFL